jgi:type 1 glutamine amidotransferase
MNGRINVLTALLIIVLCLGLPGKALTPSTNTAPLKALIVTGQCKHYHDWKTSSPILKQLLEQTGLFKVDMAVSPPHCGEMEKFQPNFAAYDVVVIDYEGDSWSEQTKTAFVEYVKSGGGVVICHSACCNFEGWYEYNKIIGLRWGGDEKLGPYIHWRDGEILHDYGAGIAGSEIAPHQFQIVVRDYEHPITKGLPKKWMHVKEGLYTKLRGPAENLTVLATAHADPNRKCYDGTYGSGEHEPVLFTINYDKGRVFHTVLGHVSPKNWHTPICAVDSIGFIVTFQRGAEWAATGKVTQKVPEDFPTVTNVSKRNNYVARPRVEFVKGEDKIDVLVGRKHFTSYLYGCKPYKIIEGNTGIGGGPDRGFLAKPILFPVRTPSGTIVTRSYPLVEVEGESKDHPGVPGVLVGFKFRDTNEDFWENTIGKPHIQHIKVTKMAEGIGKGQLSTVMHWIEKSGNILLEEKRNMVFYAGSQEYAIDFDIVLTAQDTKVIFKDDKCGFFQIRVADWLRESIESEWMKKIMRGCTGSGKYLSSNGDEFEKNVWGKRAKWVSLQGEKDGKTIGVAIFDHPASVNYPTYWMARGYGMFAANPLGQYIFEKQRGVKNPQALNLKLEPGQSAHFRYRMIIYEGPRTKEELEQRHKEFLKSA